MPKSETALAALRQRIGTRAGLALAVTLLISLPFSATEFYKLLHSGAGDFKVYLNAARVVRNHQSIHMYDGSDTGQNPQLRPSVPGTVYYQTAMASGMTEVGLYVYPPTLADAMLPFTMLSLRSARIAWWILNGAALVASALLLVWLLGAPVFGLGSLAAIAALLLFRTDITAVYWGQVTVLLLLLWTAGIVFYCKGMTRASAIALALAAAIKLTPVIVFVPILLWRDWRWLRWFFSGLIVCTALICIINGPATLADFLFHVMPPMSAGIPGILNTSLPGGIEMFYAGLTGVDVESTYFIASPAAVVLVGKLASAACLLAVFACLVRIGKPATMRDRGKVLALIALLSTCISPVAWRHAYTVVVPLLFLLWNEALRGKDSFAWLAMLGFATIEFGFIVDTLVAKVAHGWVFGAVPLIGPICGLILIFHELTRMAKLRPAAAVA